MKEINKTGELMTVDQGWYHLAPCRATGLGTPDSKADAVSFIDTFCSICSLTDKCVKSALEADFFWSVRGGRIPERFGKASMMPSTKTVKWQPKPPPVKPRDGRTILQRGICAKGLHGILTEEDLKNKGCRACRNRRNSAEGMKESGKKRLRASSTQCSRGHDKTPENGRMIDYPYGGQTRTMWSCNLCKDLLRVKGVLNSKRDRCVNGHDLSKGNVYRRTLPSGNVSFRCKICTDRHSTSGKSKA